MQNCVSKKVCLIANSYDTTINFRGHTLEALYNDGFEINLISPRGRCAIHHRPYYINNHYEIPSIGRSKSPFKFIKLLIYIFKYISRIGLCHIHVYSPAMIFATMLVTLIRRDLKIYLWFIGLGNIFIDIRNIYIKKTLRYLIRLNSNKLHLIALNLQDKLLLEDYLGISVSLILGEGLPRDKYLSHKVQKSDVLRFILIARPVADKGISDFIESIRLLQKDFLSAQFAIAGFDRSEVDPVTLQLCDLYKVVILGYIDIMETLTSSDVIVLPSKREGLSRISMEAFTLKIPMIAYDVPGISDLFKANLSEFLIDPGDVIALSKKIRGVILDRVGYFNRVAQIYSDVKLTPFATVEEVHTFYKRIMDDC